MAIRERRGGYEVLVYAGLDPLTGKQRYVSRQVKGSRRAAEREEARLKTEVADGRHVGTRAKNFGELLDLWLPWREGNGKPISPRTINDYRALIETKIKPALGRKPLVKVTAPVLDVFYEQLRERGNVKAERQAQARARREAKTAGLDAEGIAAAVAGARPTPEDMRLSPSRVHDAHVIISGAIGLAVRRGWLPHNVALSVRPAAGKGAARKTPTADQVKVLFVTVADDPEFEVFLHLSATTGLRPGEVCALRWLDTDLKAAEISVNANVITGKGLPDNYLRKPPSKGGRDHDDQRLALGPATVAMLRAHRERCAALAREFGTELKPVAFVFAREPGGSLPWRPDTAGKRFTKLAQRLGHDYTLYGLRHFVATQLGAVAAAGTVRARMRHGSLDVTSGYMHPVSEADREAARYMDDLLAGRTTWRVAPESEGV